MKLENDRRENAIVVTQDRKIDTKMKIDTLQREIAITRQVTYCRKQGCTCQHVSTG